MNRGFNFAGKVVLITGGSSGIGRATSILFGRCGAKVVIGDINAAGEETIEAIKRDKGEATFIQTDMRNSEEVKNLIATTVKIYGGLNCAFNNAGVLPPMSMLAETEESTFDQTFAVDVKGVFLTMKFEIQQMLKTGGGVIVNNASIAGLVAERGISAYVAAKHAVIGLSKAAAVEYASKGIRINAIAPGLVQTPMTRRWYDDSEMRQFFIAKTPIGRFAQPDEIANMVLFLCSDLGSFAAGQTFVVDGGYTSQ